MITWLGDFPEDATVYIPFSTFDSNDPSASVTITNLADSDIAVHKDAGLTQIATDGATVVIDFDSITGNHMVTIDTSAHADYATGSEYAVRIEGTTVDGATINAWIGAFSIERAGGVLALLKATTLASIKAETALIVADTNELQSDNVPGLIATLDAVVDTVKVDTAAILVDTNELQGDWVNGGRLDLLLDAIPTTAMRGTDGANTTTPPTVSAIVDGVWDEDVDTTHQTAGTAGKKLDDAGGAADPWATALPGAYGAGTAGKIVGDNIDAPISTVDTVVDGIQTDLSNGTDGLGAIKTSVDAIPTTAMRGTDSAALASEVTAVRMATLTDWINGGRLDLLLDAIKAKTDPMTYTNANELDANTKSINDAEVVGDGNATPWDGV